MEARQLALSRLGEVVGDADITKGLEKAIYNFAIRTAEQKGVPKFWENKEFVVIYKEKLRSILFNIKNPKNPELLAKIKSKELTPKQLLAMKPEEMHPNLWEPVYQRIKMKEMIKSGADVPEGLIQCGKCGSRRVAWYQLQTRSADEPMTVFCQCAVCSKRWKM